MSIPPDAAAHYERANELYAAGRLQEAEGCYRQALRLSPDFAKAHGNLGVILVGLGRLDEAEAALRRALELDPSLVETRLNLGVILHKRVGNRSGQALLADRRQDIGEVRRQYENLPFPPRDPEAERFILKVSTPDILAKMNQYCFAGGRDYSQPFRVLVAGCGTGDSAIWLAYQLRDTPAEIVAIDLSEASLAVAEARARVRELDNVRWVQGSLLDVAAAGLGRFDYISCLGVLHHLPDPVAGLRALESVLAEGGAMAVMLYGAVGRSHINNTQRLLRQLTKGLDHPGERLAFARKVVANLVPTNEFRQREGAEVIRNTYLSDDTNFWDTLLHAQDRAYTASQVRDYLASAGLHVQGFVSYSGIAAITALQYDLDFHLDDPAQSERLEALSPAEREDAAEMLDGSLSLHTVYATRAPNASLCPTAPDAILAPMSDGARKIIDHLVRDGGEITVALRNGAGLRYRPSDATRKFLALIDGRRSNSAIAGRLELVQGSAELDLVKRDLVIPAALHWLIARTAQGSHIPPLADRTPLSFPLLHSEPSVLPL